MTSADEIYPDHYEIKVTESNLSGKLCGKSRAGHFDGVLTVVLKLINISGAHSAYFGEKDFQQFILVKKMVGALFLETEIVPVTTIRNSEGLALSSRNLLLGKESYKKASSLYKVIGSNLSLEEMKSKLINLGFEIDYLEKEGGRIYVAAFLEGIRLIDNIENNKDNIREMNI